MLEKLKSIETLYFELEQTMSNPEIAPDYERVAALAKQKASLEDTVSLFRQHKVIQKAIWDSETLLHERDPEIAALAKQELEDLRSSDSRIWATLKVLLLPTDARDNRDVIVEIRAGTGGEEAALFAAELYRLYSRYAQLRGWHVEIIDSNSTGIGGFKEMVLEVRGKGAFSRLKNEIGVHRVQRIPATESNGRVHTSTTTVAVLPEADEFELKIQPEELRIDIFHASGHGGQNVQKVATAVRITHLPTGITAVCQDERSQLRNKQKAMAVLRARIMDIQMQKQQDELSQERRSQIGTGERSEKIRTYNFPQNRLTDHRIGLTIHGLDRVMNGELDDIIDALLAHDQTQLLNERSI
jgi:peptide chain release factor 1